MRRGHADSGGRRTGGTEPGLRLPHRYLPHLRGHAEIREGARPALRRGHRADRPGRADLYPHRRRRHRTATVIERASVTTTVQTPLDRLSEQELEKLAKEFDAIHDEVFAELGDRDRRYITAVISAQRQIVVAARVLLLGSRSKTGWLLGTACLSIAKILENMELGHNILH